MGDYKRTKHANVRSTAWCRYQFAQPTGRTVRARLPAVWYHASRDRGRLRLASLAVAGCASLASCSRRAFSVKKAHVAIYAASANGLVERVLKTALAQLTNPSSTDNWLSECAAASGAG